MDVTLPPTTNLLETGRSQTERRTRAMSDCCWSSTRMWLELSRAAGVDLAKLLTANGSPDAGDAPVVGKVIIIPD